MFRASTHINGHLLVRTELLKLATVCFLITLKHQWYMKIVMNALKTSHIKNKGLKARLRFVENSSLCWICVVPNKIQKWIHLFSTTQLKSSSTLSYLLVWWTDHFLFHALWFHKQKANGCLNRQRSIINLSICSPPSPSL